MEQRVSLITLGVQDMANTAAFYERLGWARVESPDGVVAFDLIGQTLGLYPLDALAEDIGVAAGTLGRGAVTLALALAVTENFRVPIEIKRLVGILATGFTLFTLLVQGTTLRWVIRRLGLDRLSPLDQALSKQVIAVDPLDHRLDFAKRFGATHTINASQTDPVEAIRKLTGGNGVNVAIEAVGSPKTYEQAFYARDHAGTLVQVGVPSPDMKIELPLIELFGRGGSLKSSWYGDCLPSRDFPMYIDLYLQGRLDLEKFVSETIPLDGVEDAFHKMERGEVLRSVVVF